MKKLLVCTIVICLLCSLCGCSFAKKIDLEEYSRNIDWSAEERPLVGTRIAVPLEGSVSQNGFCFSFHSDLGKLILLYRCDPPSEDGMNDGVILVMDVEYDSSEDLASSSTWKGTLTGVYPNYSAIHGNVMHSVRQMGGGSFSTISPDALRADCYGIYYPDPENPENYVAEGYVTEDGEGFVGLLFVTGRGVVPWGFQKYVYDEFDIEGLSQAS